MPTLTTYESEVYNLLQAPSSPVQLLPVATVDANINLARQQLAWDTECVRVPCTLNLLVGVSVYPFTSIIPQPQFALSVQSPISVRMVQLGQRLDLRSFEWFFNYYLNQGNVGLPIRVAQQGQGNAG